MSDHTNENDQTPALTERQAKAWPEAVARLREHYDSIPADLRSWDVLYAEETRPGRGHFVNATWVDGEVFAQVLMDVYGQPNVSIADLSWVHADSDEECACDPCERERAAEDDPAFPPAAEPVPNIGDTCCGNCPGGTCYVDGVTGA